MNVVELPTVWLLEAKETADIDPATAEMTVSWLVLSESITEPELEVTEMLIGSVGLLDLGFVTWFSLISKG